MRRSRICLLLLFFFLGACHGSEEERVRQTLNQRGEAFNKKDLSLYLSCFSRDYQDKDGDLAHLRRTIGAYFSNFDLIEYDYWDRSVQIDGETATAIQQFHLDVERGGKKIRHSGKEAFLLRKEGKHWKILKTL
jgi:ketosteroid isomerase-like protein